MTAPENRESAVQDFRNMTGASAEQATQYLEGNGWDMIAACNSFFEDDDERNAAGDTGSAADQDDNYTGPRTLDGRPAPQATSSRNARKAPQPKRRGIATLGSLGGGHGHDDDDDDHDHDDEEDDGRGNLFAGGEKSGLAVQDPNNKQQEGRGLINDILAKAKANTRGAPDAEAGPSQANRFRGTGQTLGGEGVESRSIPDPLGPMRSGNVEPQERILHIWQDGFSIDDGELRRYDDPANSMDLQMIRSGRAPLHLMNVQHDQPVDVKLHQHEGPYTAQPRSYRPFHGSGQRLGSPVPGDGSEAVPISSITQSGPAPTVTSSTTTEPSVDSSQPTIMIRIQLPDGTRLPARFNPTQTLADVYEFVQAASPDTRSRPWVLATTFPNKEHGDQSLSLSEVPEFKKGGTAVVKWT